MIQTLLSVSSSALTFFFPFFLFFQFNFCIPTFLNLFLFLGIPTPRPRSLAPPRISKIMAKGLSVGRLHLRLRLVYERAKRADARRLRVQPIHLPRTSNAVGIVPQHTERSIWRDSKTSDHECSDACFNQSKRVGAQWLGLQLKL